MSKNIFALKVSAAAVAVALSGLAISAVNLDASPTGASSYASELVTNGTTALTGAAMNVSHKLGFGVSNTQTRYIRYDLTNAKFNAAPLAADLVVGASTAALVQGGAAGDTYVIYQITAAADYTANQNVIFGLDNATGANGVKVTDKSSSVSIAYSLYESAANAVAKTGMLNGAGSGLSGTLATIGSALTFTTTTNSTTAGVTSLYKNFTDGVSTTVAKIGVANVGVNGYLHPTTGNAAVIADLLAAGTKLTVTGTDLSAASAANAIFLSTDAACAGVGTGAGTVASTSTTADIVIGAATVTTKGICFTANGTTPIKDQTFTLSLTPGTGSTATAPSAATLGAFTRNGTVLKVPFISGLGTTSNFVQLANMGTTAASYTTRCFGGASTTATGADATGTIAVGATKKIYLSGVTCPANSNALEFTLAVPEGNVVGTYVRQNSTTGASSFSDVTGNK